VFDAFFSQHLLCRSIQVFFPINTRKVLAARTVRDTFDFAFSQGDGDGLWFHRIRCGRRWDGRCNTTLSGHRMTRFLGSCVPSNLVSCRYALGPRGVDPSLQRSSFAALRPGHCRSFGRGELWNSSKRQPVGDLLTRRRIRSTLSHLSLPSISLFFVLFSISYCLLQLIA
jgi:hypothetical protein